MGNGATAETQAAISRVTKYYYHGGQRVAMRRGSVVYYVHADHLGSTSLTTDEDGDVVARQLYYPYGEVRWITGTLPTDFGFTGQREHPGLGLVFMHARYYHAGLGRWMQADTIAPGIGSQGLNRYMYVRGNPVLYNDPSGHADPVTWIVITTLVVALLSGCNSAPALPPSNSELRGGGHYEVHHYEDKVVVTADIQIYGEGASPEVAQRYEQAIEKTWNRGGSSYNELPVIFDVNVYHKEPDAGWRREFPIIGSPTRPERGEGDASNMIFVEPGHPPNAGGAHPHIVPNDGSYDWDWGVWWADMHEGVIAHEAGHLFGLPDRRDAAHHDWITGNPNGLVEPGRGEVYEIITTGKYQYFHYDEND